MVQFYFLSVLINIIAGLILVYGMNLCEKNDLIPSSAKSTDFSEDIDDEDPFADIEAPASSPAPSAPSPTTICCPRPLPIPKS